MLRQRRDGADRKLRADGVARQEGSWNGVKLDGLTVAAAVRARATLGNSYGHPYPAEAVLLVDDAANAEQRQALIALAHHEGGKLLENVARVEYVPVVLEVPQNPHEGHATLRAGHLATIITRPLNHHDHICGNETNFYPPLSQRAACDVRGRGDG